MKLKGILLPVYALPSPYGIGEFSKEAFKLIDELKKNGFNAWQVLPLNPVGYGHSPYQSLSSYALEEAYISLDDLFARGLISKPVPFNENKKYVEYEDVIRLKRTYYLEAYFNFINKGDMIEFKEFKAKNPRLVEYAKYVSLKDLNKNVSWSEWTVFDDPKLSLFIDYHLFLQMVLFQEWDYIKKHAEDIGVKIIGDIPFYVGYDSSDVYFNQNYFLLENSKPTYVSGVGPDYFSKEGQLWGNPIYFYGAMYQNNYDFIIDRILATAKIYDMVRIDHFRAFDTYYVIKAGEKNAINGEWWECPGYEILDKLFSKKKDINLIAEDLGLLRKEVYTLRDHYNLPGMNVIQFNIFEDIKEKKDTSNLITYLGTHDNMTTVSFIRSLTNSQKKELRAFFKKEGIKSLSLFDCFVKYLFKHENAIISFVDLLKLNDKYRINEPSKVSPKNWSSKLSDSNKLYKMLRKVSND